MKALIWDGGQKVVRDALPEDIPDEIAPTVDMIKAEAERKILAIIPEWKQRNLIAQAVRLAKKGEANWTPEELAAWNAGEAIWAQVEGIRAASDLIEVDLPVDYLTDPRWP